MINTDWVIPAPRDTTAAHLSLNPLTSSLELKHKVEILLLNHPHTVVVAVVVAELFKALTTFFYVEKKSTKQAGIPQFTIDPIVTRHSTMTGLGIFL